MYVHGARACARLGALILAVAIGGPVLGEKNDPRCPEPDRQAEPVDISGLHYPRPAATFCIEGTATVEFTIDADGRVRDPVLVESDPEGIFAGAVESVRTWRFRPQCRNGHAVERRATQTVVYRLPPDRAALCPQQFSGELREVLIALTALYVDVQGRVFDLSDPLHPVADESSLPEPYAEIEKAHREYLNRALEIARVSRSVEEDYFAILDPQRLGRDDQHLSRTRALIDSVFDRRRAIFDQLQDSLDRLGQRLRTLDTTLDLEPDARTVLIGPYTEHIGNDLADRVDLDAMNAEIEYQVRRLIGLLADHPGDWHVRDGELAFDDPRLAKTFNEGKSALDALHAEWDRRFMLPHRIDVAAL